jgi:hypothetical protein
MDNWNTRKQSMAWLQNELTEEGKIIDKGFDLLNICVSLMDDIGREEGDKQIGKFFRIGAITLAKSRHFLFGCYSLSFDGLSQESGALIRPLIETYELLVYLRLDPFRVEEVISEKLPSAGEIAKKINGNFHGLRQHLNEHASHFQFKYVSVRHLLDFSEEVIIKPIPTQDISVFLRNLNTLNAFQTILLVEASNWLESITDNSINTVDEIQEFCEMSNSIFSTRNET